MARRWLARGRRARRRDWARTVAGSEIGVWRWLGVVPRTLGDRRGDDSDTRHQDDQCHHGAGDQAHGEPPQRLRLSRGVVRARRGPGGRRGRRCRRRRRWSSRLRCSRGDGGLRPRGQLSSAALTEAIRLGILGAAIRAEDCHLGTPLRRLFAGRNPRLTSIRHVTGGDAECYATARTEARRDDVLVAMRAHRLKEAHVLRLLHQ